MVRLIGMICPALAGIDRAVPNQCGTNLRPQTPHTLEKARSSRPRRVGVSRGPSDRDGIGGTTRVRAGADHAAFRIRYDRLDRPGEPGPFRPFLDRMPARG